LGGMNRGLMKNLTVITCRQEGFSMAWANLAGG
jgi:hypothetical protein